MTNNKVEIEIEFEEDLLFELMKLAHSKDITLNQLIETILREFIKNQESKYVPKID